MECHSGVFACAHTSVLYQTLRFRRPPPNLQVRILSSSFASSSFPFLPYPSFCFSRLPVSPRSRVAHCVLVVTVNGKAKKGQADDDKTAGWSPPVVLRCGRSDFAGADVVVSPKRSSKRKSSPSTGMSCNAVWMCRRSHQLIWLLFSFSRKEVAHCCGRRGELATVR